MAVERDGSGALALDDERWRELRGVCGGDIAALLRTLADAPDEHMIDALWTELCHQGTICIASYAALPHLVANASCTGPLAALAASIELARDGDAPSMPDWACASYDAALQGLAQRAAQDLAVTRERHQTRVALAIVAIDRGLRLQAHALLDLTDDELAEMLGTS